MKFRRVALERAKGHILGHNVSQAGRRMLKKGCRLGEMELAELAVAGHESVYVAELDPSDVAEDAAAWRIGRALADRCGLRAQAAHGGRVSLRAPERGLLSVRSETLLDLNLLEGVTLATLPDRAVVAPGQHIGTLKVIPFALPESTVAAAERLGAAGILGFRALGPRRVAVLISGAEGRRARLFDAYRVPLEQRLAALGSHPVSVEFIPLDSEPERALEIAVREHLDRELDLLIVVGETATMDKDDLAPQAIRKAGGEVLVVGAPVFPGNLLLLGYRGKSAILGAPGCVRSRAKNVVDLLLPRLLIGERLGARDIAELGQGGLLGSADEKDESPGGADG
jgi:molybdenum cofactor cytidylyltransferase